MPETCGAYCKCKKPFSSIQLVSFLRLYNDARTNIHQISLQSLHEIFLILSTIHEIPSQTYASLRVDYAKVQSSEFKRTWIFSDRFLQELSNTKFRKNPFSGMRAAPYGQTDMTKLASRFSQILHTRLKKMNKNTTNFVKIRSLGAELLHSDRRT